MTRPMMLVAGAALVVVSLLPDLPAAALGQGTTAPVVAIPRTSQGVPDFSGVWQAVNTAAWNIEAHHADWGTPPGMGVVEGGALPYQPSALEKRKEKYERRLSDDTDVKCYMPGVPRITYMPHPFEVFQAPTHIMITYEYLHVVRTLYLDGSPHPEGPIDWWMGDSRARWEGDTLVVDVVHFNDQTTFDKSGNFHSDKLHVVERYSFIDKDHLNYEATIEDPEVFTRPWTMRMPLYRRIETHIRPLEYDCYAFKNLWKIPPQ